MNLLSFLTFVDAILNPFYQQVLSFITNIEQLEHPNDEAPTWHRVTKQSRFNTTSNT